MQVSFPECELLGQGSTRLQLEAFRSHSTHQPEKRKELAAVPFLFIGQADRILSPPSAFFSTRPIDAVLPE